MTPEQQVAHDYIESRESVFRYLARMGIQAPEAQEMTQEVFLRLFVTLQKGEQIRHTRAWVFRVAHNLALNSILRRPPVEPFDGQMELRLRDGAATPEDAMFETRRIDEVQRAFNTLSPQQRQCLHLRAEGLRYREIAETIGITVSSVNEFLSRGLKRLRKATE